jgi:hypothetical protein
MHLTHLMFATFFTVVPLFFYTIYVIPLLFVLWPPSLNCHAQV